MFVNFNSLKKTNFRMFVYTAPIKFISSLGFIMFNIYMINYIDKNNIGNFLLCLSIIALLSIFSKAGLTFSTLRIMSIIYNNNDNERFFPNIKKILYLSTSISLILISLILIFEDYIALSIYKNNNIRGLLTIIVFSLPFYTFVQIQKSIIKSFKLPYIAPLADMGMILIFIIILTSLSSIFSFSINAYRLAFLFLIINIILFAFFNLLILYLFFYNLNPKNNKKYLNENINSKSLFDFFVIDFVNYVFVWGSIFICSFYLDPRYLTDFSSIYWLAFTPLFIPVVLNSIYSPIFAIHYNENNILKLNKSFKECRNISIYLCLPIIIALFLFSSQILSLIFNIEGNEYNYCFKLLILAALIRILFGPVQNLLNMCNNENFVRKITLNISLAQIIMTFIFVSLYGIISLALIYLFFNFLKFLLLSNRFKKILVTT